VSINVAIEYGISVKVWNPARREYGYFWMHPTGLGPYRFPTQEAAWRQASSSYPLADRSFVTVLPIIKGDKLCQPNPHQVLPSHLGSQ
jgi:hypothetical protein